MGPLILTPDNREYKDPAKATASHLLYKTCKTVPPSGAQIVTANHRAFLTSHRCARSPNISRRRALRKRT